MKSPIDEAYKEMTSLYLKEEAKIADKAIIFKITYKKAGQTVEKMISSVINHSEADGEGDITIDTGTVKIVTAAEAKTALEQFNAEQAKKAQEAAAKTTAQTTVQPTAQQATPAAPA